MHWFKHYSNARRDPVIHEAIHIFGPKGYYIYFGIIEMYAENFNVNSPHIFNTTWTQLRQELSFHKVSIQIVLDFYKRKHKLDWASDNNTLWIKIPKFQEVADEYTRNKLSKVSGHKKESVRTPLGTLSGKNRTDQKRYKSSYKAPRKQLRGPHHIGSILKFIFTKNRKGNKNGKI